MSSIIEADMLEWSKLIISSDNSMHTITGQYLNFQMHSVSSKVYITGSVLGGEYDGFANEVYVTGPVRDLPISGNKNTLASGDCSEVSVQSVSSFCTILEEGEMPLTIPSIPCTFAACKRSCVASHYGYCHCKEEDCAESNTSTVEEDKNVENVFGGEVDEATSAASVASSSLLIVASVVLAVFVF
jgi:hypothetical protein